MTKRNSIIPIFNMTRGLFLLVCLAASPSGISLIAGAQDDGSTPVFETPEDAITFYLEAVIQGDTAQILQASAVDEMSANFDFERAVNRVGSLTIHTPASSDHPFYVELNKAQFTSQILGQVKNLAYGLLATEKDVVEGLAVFIEPEGTTRFMNEVNPERLTELQVIEIGVPLPHLANDARNLENWAELARIYGADELTERIVLLEFDEDIYYTGFTLLRYDESWKISSAASPLGGISITGAPMLTTVEDFQDLIRGD